MSGKSLTFLLYQQVDSFLDSLDEKAQDKLDSTFDAISEVGSYDPKKLKKLSPSPIFEIRQKVRRGAVRILAFYDTSDPDKPILVCCHAFFKKTQKTPKNLIDKAARMRTEYFD